MKISILERGQLKPKSFERDDKALLPYIENQSAHAAIVDNGYLMPLPVHLIPRLNKALDKAQMPFWQLLGLTGAYGVGHMLNILDEKGYPDTITEREAAEMTLDDMNLDIPDELFPFLNIKELALQAVRSGKLVQLGSVYCRSYY